MSDPYIGQVEAFAFNYAPRGWALCAGQLLPISQNQALFTLIGTTYGGNGQTNFALPDLRGHAAMGQGAGHGLTPRTVGAVGGQELHTMLLAEMPATPHTHPINAVATAAGAGASVPGGSVSLGTAAVAADGSAVNVYGSGGPVGMGALGSAGGQPHENRMPYVTISWCIALNGLFPSRT